ncbi:MAG TPA: alpha/beta fold hydrolase [Caulobacteraceae bacterium]|nr:alpha/beta fold hydrolase [Caulobacteraceae bacterium]
MNRRTLTAANRARALVLAAALVAAGCTPLVERPLTPPAGFAGPRLESDAVVSFDGTRLGLATYLPAGGSEPWAVIVGVHGLNSYARAYHEAGPYWAAHGVAVYAYDQRGFGRSPGRGHWAGEALFTEDLRTVCALVRQRYPHAVIAVAATSMGGSVAIEAFAADRPPTADRLILLAPEVSGWSDRSPAYEATVWTVAHVAPGARFTPPDWLLRRLQGTDNTEELASARRDPLMTWRMRPDEFYGLANLSERAAHDTARLKVPTAYLFGVKDRIEPLTATERAAAALPPGDVTADYPEGWHLLLLDHHRQRVFDDILGFLRDPAQPLASHPSPIPRPN